MAGKGGQTIGYHYLLSILAGICRGPINALVEIRGDDKQVWVGDRLQDMEVMDSTPTAINSPDAYGGEEREGGVQGVFRLFQGRYDQMLPTESSTITVGSRGPARIGTLPPVKSTIGGNVSELRGFVTLWFDGLISSMSPYAKELKFRGWRTTAGWHNDDCWYPEKATITLNGDGAYGFERDDEEA